MRLIDADKLYLPPEDIGSRMAVAYAPTAYNVNKVIVEVNEVLDRLFNFCEEIDLNLPEDERTGYKMLDDIQTIRDIVKRGGID